MSFNGNEGAFITLEEGSVMTANYRNTIQQGEVIGQFIRRDLIQDILAQTDCVGIRFYYAIDENGSKNLVCVGVDQNENDLTEGLIADRFKSCPPKCSKRNPLNS
jgi:hypothetical protein